MTPEQTPIDSSPNMRIQPTAKSAAPIVALLFAAVDA